MTRSEDGEVRRLAAALAAKIAESRSELSTQAVGSALYGLQRLSSESLEVRRPLSGSGRAP